MVKKIYLVLCVIIVVASMIGCTSTPPAESSNAPVTSAVSEPSTNTSEAVTTSEPLKFAILLPDLANLWWIDMKDGAQAECDKNGIELLIHDAKGDVTKQVSAIENYVAQGVDALIVGAVEPNALETACKQAMDQGIPVVTIATPLENSFTNVSIAERTMGEICGGMAAQWIKENYGDEEVEVAILAYDILPTVIERADTMIEILNRETPNAIVVSRQQAATVEEGLAAGEAVLQAHPNVKVVCGINDGGVLGFAKAFYNSGKAGPDVGCFAVATAAEFIEDMIRPESVLRGTMDNKPEEVCANAVRACISLLDGETVPEIIYSDPEPLWQADAAAWKAAKGE